MENFIEESRRRNRYDYNKNILCLKYKDISSYAKVKLPFLLTTNDISYSGIGAKCSQRLSPGSILTFNLVSKMNVREMSLEVMWSKFSYLEFKAGLKFINLTYEDVIFIDEIIKNIR